MGFVCSERIARAGLWEQFHPPFKWRRLLSGIPDYDVHRRDLQCPLNVCAVTRRRVPVGASPTRQALQPKATGAVMF
jgi:hypothetical protein